MEAVANSPSFRHFGTWFGILLLVPLVMFLDSASLAERVSYGQWAANLAMLIVFVATVYGAPRRLRVLMLCGIGVAVLGEVMCSLVFGMYEYRLHNVPLYVLMGHSALYAAVYYFVREPAVVRNQRLLMGIMMAVGLGYAGYWLVAHHDVYGALCTVLYVYLIRRLSDSRLFFMSMFLLVAYLELFGTGFGCWYWPPTLFDRVPFIPSGNPPSGIAVFYFGFDGACLDWMFKLTPRLRKRYFRIKQRREHGVAEPLAVSAS